MLKKQKLLIPRMLFVLIIILTFAVTSFASNEDNDKKQTSIQSPPALTYSNKCEYQPNKYINWLDNNFPDGNFKTELNDDYGNSITHVYVDGVEVPKAPTYNDFQDKDKYNYFGWCFDISSKIHKLYIGNSENNNLDQYKTQIKIEADGYKNLIINPIKIAPKLTTDTTDITIPYGETQLKDDIELTFESDKEWQSAITKVFINDKAINENLFDKTVDGKIILDKSLFKDCGQYAIKISANGYLDTNYFDQKIYAQKTKVVKGGEYIYEPLVLEVKDSKWLNDIGDKITIYYTNSSGRVRKKYTISKTDSSTKDINPSFYIKDNKIYINFLAMKIGQNYNDVDKVFICFDTSRKISNRYDNLEINIPKVKGDTQQIDADTTTNYLGGKINLTMNYTPVNKDEVLAYRDSIFAVESSSTKKVCPYEINTIEDKQDIGTVTIQIDVSSEQFTGNRILHIYAQGYDVQNVLQRLNEVEKSPKLKLSKTSYYKGDDVSLTYPNDEQQYFPNWYKNLTKVEVSPSGKEPFNLDLDKEIYFNPDAKSITIPGNIFEDITSGSLYFYSKGYSRQCVNFEFCPERPSPLVKPMENANYDKNVVLTFGDNSDWSKSITSIKVDGTSLDKSKYTIDNCKIIIDKSVFTSKNESYNITVLSENFAPVNLTQCFGTNKSKDSFDETKFTNDEKTKTYFQVIYGDKTYNFTKMDLYKLAAEEGNKAYTYSTYNTWPTYSQKTNSIGPTLNGILKKAGININELDDDQTVKAVSGGDGMTDSFTVKGLLKTPRYFYPNGNDETLYETYSIFRGGAHDSKYWKGKVEVPAIIALDEENGIFRFGQIYPNEQTNFAFNKFMVIEEGSTSKAPGKIVIGTKDNLATKFDIPTPNIKSGSTVKAGTELDFGKCGYGKCLMYTVSTDGTEPKDPIYLDILYDYASFRDCYYNYKFTDKPTIIKAYYTSTVRTSNTNELLDSEVITLYYNGAQPKAEHDLNINIGDENIKSTVDYNYSAVFTHNEMKQIFNDKAIGKNTASTNVKINSVLSPSKLDICSAKKELQNILKQGQNGSILMYFNIDMFKILDGKTQTQVTDLNGKEISVTLNISKEYQKDGRDYYIICIDDEKTKVLKDQDSNPNTITFKTGLFSTYVLAFSEGTPITDTTTKPTENNITKNDVTNSSSSTVPMKNEKSTKNSKQQNPPKTNDDNVIVPSVVFVVASSAMAIYIERKRKSNNIDFYN